MSGDPTPEPPAPRRRAKGRDRLTRILDAALALTAREGSGALSMRAIAAAADVPLGSVTYYFATKDALVDAALDRAAEIELEWVRGSLTSEPPRTVAGAATLVVELVLHALDARREGTIAHYELWLELSRRPHMGTVALRQQAALEELAAWILSGIGARAPDATAGLLVAAMDGLALRLLAEGAPEPERLARDVGILLDALRVARP